ncbi:MAG: hypothetical protein FADNKDHG_01362 [Holosporales bacterium]
MKIIQVIIFFSLLLSASDNIFCTSLDKKLFKEGFDGGQYSSEEVYKTCFYPYENSYEYAENALVHLYNCKIKIIRKLLEDGFINEEGIVLKKDEGIKDILNKFWSRDNYITLEARKHSKEFKRDFDRFMDKAFEDDYIPKSSVNVNTLRHEINIISSIIDLTIHPY